MTNHPLADFDLQLLATDLDGTLLRSDHTISPRTLAALRRVLAAGIPIIAVSGRPPRFIRPLLHQYALKLPFASYNGAAIYASPHDDAPLCQQVMDSVTALAIIAALRKYEPALNLQMESGDQMYADRLDEAMAERLRLDSTLRPPHGLGMLETQLTERELTMHKLLTFVGKERMNEALAYINALGHGVYATTSGRGLLEIMAAGVDKAKAAAWWAARQQIAPANVLAFGDELNDIPMLRWAGRGVAMGNAQAEVRAAADYITLSNEDDGVAVLLEQLI